MIETTDRTAEVYLICVVVFCVTWMICVTIERVYAPKVCPKCQAVQIEGKQDD